MVEITPEMSINITLALLLFCFGMCVFYIFWETRGKKWVLLDVMNARHTLIRITRRVFVTYIILGYVFIAMKNYLKKRRKNEQEYT